MPFDLNNQGLQTQSIAEVKTELETSFKDKFGQNINLSSDSVLGIIIGIFAYLYWSAQLVLLKVYNAFSPLSAKGITLDKVVAVGGTVRKPATHSRASARFNGTNGTVILNNSLVRLIQTNTQWKVVDGPYIIGGGGFVDGFVEAVDTGPITALTTGPGGWEILTPIIGWDTFETLEDAIPGQTIESDAKLRERYFVDLFKKGNDVASIRASVLSIPEVLFVKVFENMELVPDIDGLPGKSFEVLVDGGDDNDIADAIFLNKPAGIKAFGLSVTIDVPDGEGGTVPISFTRPTDIDIWLKVTITTSNAEDAFPVNGVQLIEDALLEYAKANHDMGDDVIPDFFVGPVYNTIKNKSVTNVLVQVSKVSFAAAIDAIIAIGKRERAQFDSARIQVLEV